MNGFEYKYYTPNDIFNNILLISEISPIYLGLFLVSIIFIILLHLYIIPSINIIVVNYIKDTEAKKRKNFLQLISIQKDIEDQISKEIDVH